MNVAQFAAANPRYPVASLALSVPPTTLPIAEQHGLLDGEDEATFAAAQNPTDPASAGVAIQLGPVIERRPWLGPWPGRMPKTLALAERLAGVRPELAWSADDTMATVSLAQAEQASVRVSSYLPDDFLDRFAIRRWLEPGAEAAASGGQHPMVTPAREIPLIHAVRKPLRDPSGTLQAEREQGQTWTSLVPSSDRLNIDPASTAQVQITATWDEWADEPQPTPASATVQSITMHADDAKLPPLRHQVPGRRLYRCRHLPVPSVLRRRRARRRVPCLDYAHRHSRAKLRAACPACHPQRPARVQLGVRRTRPQPEPLGRPPADSAGRAAADRTGPAVVHDGGGGTAGRPGHGAGP
jgi:hypothetical protein